LKSYSRCEPEEEIASAWYTHSRCSRRKILWVESGQVAMAEGEEDSPAIMVVAVNMQNLLALDTQNTIPRQWGWTASWLLRQYPESTHSVNPAHDIQITEYQRGGWNLPVPRTTTSYSGAISSIFKLEAEDLEECVSRQWSLLSDQRSGRNYEGI
jgi:hypothetical protein